MGDEAPQCKVEYTDVDPVEETNWIKRAGKCKVTYVNGHIFEGTFDAERLKQGEGSYVWMEKVGEDGEVVEKARFTGAYKDGFKTGYGEMKFPNGDIYQGEWSENTMQGTGSYTYRNGDIYSGSWALGKKSGEGTYFYKADSSVIKGTWVEGELSTGTWELYTGDGFVYATYTGAFKMGKPYGDGKFDFPISQLAQTGKFEEVKVAGEEEPAEGDAAKAPNVAWKGDSIVAF